MVSNIQGHNIPTDIILIKSSHKGTQRSGSSLCFQHVCLDGSPERHTFRGCRYQQMWIPEHNIVIPHPTIWLNLQLSSDKWEYDTVLQCLVDKSETQEFMYATPVVSEVWAAGALNNYVFHCFSHHQWTCCSPQASYWGEHHWQPGASCKSITTALLGETIRVHLVPQWPAGCLWEACKAGYKGSDSTLVAPQLLLFRDIMQNGPEPKRCT